MSEALLEELHAVREKRKTRFGGLGEPVILIPATQLLVNAKDGSEPKMRMDNFIALVRDILNCEKS